MKEDLSLRLTALRKYYGYTQEELAIKLGVTRQAIIKWEQGETSPSIDYIKALCDLYDISIDDLLNFDIPIEKLFKEKKQDNYVNIDEDGLHVKEGDTEVHIDSSGVHVYDGDNEKYNGYSKGYRNAKTKLVSNIIDISSILIFVVIYLILGFTLHENDFGFITFWPILFYSLVPSSLYKAIVKKNFTKFNIIFLILGTYLLVGMYGETTNAFNGWAYPALMFLIIPIYYSLANAFKNLMYYKNKINRKDKTIDLSD